MSLFFALLPADLHIDILQTWVGLGLSALSALDAAFCSRADRPHFLVCLQLACRHRTGTIGEKESNSACNDLVQCLTWMKTRKIPVVGLNLFARSRRDVRVGRRGTLVKTGNHEHADIFEILRLSPKVKHISYLNSNPFSGIMGPELGRSGSDDKELFWQVLASTQLDCLESISYDSHGLKLLGVDGIESALQAMGAQLKVLHLNSCSTNDNPNILRAIATYCQSLQEFCCRDGLKSVADVVDLVQALRHLATLSIFYLRLDRGDVQQILRAGGQLRRFHISKFGLNGWDLIEVLKEFPQLEHLQFGENFVYDKNEHLLQFTDVISGIPTIHPQQWEGIFTLCPALVTLSTFVKEAMIGGSEDAIGATYGPSMRDLTFLSTSPNDLPLMKAMLPRFPNIVKFTLMGCGVANLDLLKVVASVCSKLQYLQLTENDLGSTHAEDETQITDADMEDLLINCPALHSLFITVPAKITQRTFEAILRRKTFKMLTFGKNSSCVTADDVLQILARGRELQLLPLPTIIVRGVYDY